MGFNLLAGTRAPLRVWTDPYQIEAQAARQLRNIGGGDEPISCHHNYVSEEHYEGVDVLVTRKGAIRAGLGDLGIIPGSMGTGSYIVRGKGNDWGYCSASHGAGRRMSRAQAKRT